MRWMRKLERGRKDCLNSGLSRECFSEILQNFHSAGYMPSARSILLLLLAVASLRSKNLEKSSHDTSPYLFTFKFANLSHRDPYLENVKFDSARFDAALLSCQGGRGLNCEVAPFPLDNPPSPTTLLKWRHCFALQAKRRGVESKF